MSMIFFSSIGGIAFLSLPEKTIAVRERWKEKRSVSRPEVLEQFSPATVAVLRNDMAPLMQWINLAGPADAYVFDLLVTRMQTELLAGSGRFADLKDKFLSWISELILHLNPVRERAATLKQVKASAFWDTVSIAALEEIRKELRGIMHPRQKDTTTSGYLITCRLKKKGYLPIR
jgi:type I restriction enzyme R subunit